MERAAKMILYFNSHYGYDVRQKGYKKTYHRKIASYVIHEVTGLPWLQISKIFNTDHSTLLYYRDWIDVNRKHYPSIDKEIRYHLEILKENLN